MSRFMACLLLSAGLVAGTPRTFTDQMGRTITAEIVSAQNDQAAIRRIDGQRFTLVISTLSDDDPLIAEQSSPETLLTKEKWSKPQAG